MNYHIHRGKLYSGEIAEVAIIRAKDIPDSYWREFTRGYLCNTRLADARETADDRMANNDSVADAIYGGCTKGSHARDEGWVLVDPAGLPPRENELGPVEL